MNSLLYYKHLILPALSIWKSIRHHQVITKLYNLFSNLQTPHRDVGPPSHPLLPRPQVPHPWRPLPQGDCYLVRLGPGNSQRPQRHLASRSGITTWPQHCCVSTNSITMATSVCCEMPLGQSYIESKKKCNCFGLLIQWSALNLYTIISLFG